MGNHASSPPVVPVAVHCVSATRPEEPLISRMHQWLSRVTRMCSLELYYTMVPNESTHVWMLCNAGPMIRRCCCMEWWTNVSSSRSNVLDISVKLYYLPVSDMEQLSRWKHGRQLERMMNHVCHRVFDPEINYYLQYSWCMHASETSTHAFFARIQREFSPVCTYMTQHH